MLLSDPARGFKALTLTVSFDLQQPGSSFPNALLDFPALLRFGGLKTMSATTTLVLEQSQDSGLGIYLLLYV